MTGSRSTAKSRRRLVNIPVRGAHADVLDPCFLEERHMNALRACDPARRRGHTFCFLRPHPYKELDR